MANAIRYRTGVDRETGEILRGIAHLRQSLAVIWVTVIGTRIMRLEFGSRLRGHLGDDITPALALDIYVSMVEAAHRYEPEYRISSLQFVKLERDGTLGVRYAGTYFPEGRFGNYDVSDDDQALVPMTLTSQLGVN
ncbi:hypothetical protein DFR52_106232 [Hoeflea marina]|uniref:IraD/Gp25-like domain-containing protein n=1 Tax=Hoeflea marina TaxID=274592 RepID=A0A317PJD1_9HYPH|nr:integrase [Hoeflea marina]PWV97707.1 hypothetical protein DFR52_106232 [Hoeflea marina]